MTFSHRRSDLDDRHMDWEQHLGGFEGLDFRFAAILKNFFVLKSFPKVNIP